jgi:N-acetylglucosamine-6-sulfatase
MVLLFHSFTRTATVGRPNIVFIMVDDLDVRSLETMLAFNAMPNFRTMFVDQGVRFNQSFVSDAICCPSRATFLSGQYTHNHHTLTNSIVNGAVTGFDDTMTLATWLASAGYRTAHIGKYLNSYGLTNDLSSPDLAPNDRQQILGLVAYLEQNYPATAVKLQPTYVPPGWTEWHGLLDTSTYCTYNYSINSNGHVVQYLKNGRVVRDGVEIRPSINDGVLHNYQTDVLGEHAKSIIQRNLQSFPAQPFFLALTPLVPHIEKCNTWDPEGPTIDIDAPYRDQFQFDVRPALRHLGAAGILRNFAVKTFPNRASFNVLDPGKPAELRQKLNPLDDTDKNGLYRQYGNRLASLLAVDDLIGTVTAALGNEINNTVLIFTSDNGWFYGDHQLTGKLLAYEESIRVPLYMRLPGSGSPRQITASVLNIDLAPTITAWAGATPTRVMDGRSLLPLLENLTAPP